MIERKALEKMAEIKQRVVWTSTDECVLIDLWRERADDLRRAKRNLHIYADISVQMAHKFTPKEVHIKIRNLSQRYREEKKKTGPSGGSPSTWKYFDAVNQIIGLTAANNAEIYESLTVDISSSTLLPLPPSVPAASPVTMSPEPLSPVIPSTSSPLLSPLDTSSTSMSTSKKRNYMGELVKVAKQQHELLKVVVEDGRDLKERIINCIEEQNSSTKEFISIFKNLLEKM
ncbi:uncharacterized protein LOC128920368 [Zeugodacus cucurbitae]|uniref:uncharacterized protein LOC128920368 n=1 Tax=Zeugodacus cucurbitae TaxID=28588 RepID=UPI0023D8FC54|nr:uncharacterized protein LOC128920368 [Zeugodacus cucurbitae]